MRVEKVIPILLCQLCVSAICKECVMDAQRHRIDCPLVRVPSPGRISERIQTRYHAPFEIRQSPPGLPTPPAEWHVNFPRLFQRHEHPFAARVLDVIPTFFRRHKGEGISRYYCVMLIRNVEREIERVRA